MAKAIASDDRLSKTLVRPFMDTESSPKYTCFLSRIVTLATFPPNSRRMELIKSCDRGRGNFRPVKAPSIDPATVGSTKMGITRFSARSKTTGPREVPITTTFSILTCFEFSPPPERRRQIPPLPNSQAPKGPKLENA